MTDSLLDFEQKEFDLSHAVALEARGNLDSSEVIGMTLTGFPDGERFYSVSFGLEDAQNTYEVFMHVASRDELRETDDVQLGYRDEEEEHQREILELGDDLPDDLSKIG